MSHGNKKYNAYDLLSRDYGVGYTLRGEEFYFDKEDYEKINSYCWHIEKTRRRVCTRNTEGGTPIKMHRLLLDFPSLEYDIDHINRNTVDNRKINLRICLHSENIKNRSIQRNNSTGVIGVYFRKDTGKYSSMIEVNGKIIRLGCTENMEDSVRNRLLAEIKYFGDYAPQKHLFNVYNITEGDF